MKVYDGVLAAPIPVDVLATIATIVDRELLASLDQPPCMSVPTGFLVEV